MTFAVVVEILLRSGLGNHYGTLGGPIEYFKPTAKPYESTKGEKRNIITNPGKMGTGFGYGNVTINKFPEYKSDSYGRAGDLFKVITLDYFFVA